jgi:PAS domain S-box-containing protein
VREALPDVAGQGFFELLDGVYASGQPFFGRGLKVSLQRSPAAPLENRSVDFVYQPVLSDAGNVIGIFVEGTDITDRIAAEEALRASETLFRNFAEAMPNHVWTSTPDGLLDWFNTRVYEYCGASPGELDGQGWAKIVHPEDLSAAAIRWADALDSGKNYETAFRLRRADGVYRWHLARAVLLRDEGGLPTRWIGTNTDIENQRRADKQLVDSERRLRLSQNAAGIASVELDIATGDVFGSDSFWTLWGLTPRESISITELERIVLPEDRHIRSTPETRQSGTAVPNVEYRIRRPDTGELRWVSRQIEFIHDEAGKPVTMFGVMRDITREKEAQGRQEMLTHELEHRIKNILATVSAIASQTLRNTDIDTARNALNLRLRALADAHDILTKSHWTSASLVSVIRAAVAPLPTDRISIEGPDVAIGPKKALSLALAVNELGTNALKYGALSGVEGKVAIAWSKEIFSDTQERLIWRWTEMLGPPVVQPTRRGFGRFLLDRVLAADFDGQTHIDFLPEGLTCTLSAPWPNAL